jgi:RNA polymerase sigma-70 factor (TIGR02943 family)
MSFEQDVAALRPDLLRYARLQMRNETWAEDAVGETLLAACAKPQAFERRSMLRTWLIGILKHKIIDHFRARKREVALDGDDGFDEELQALGFQPDGHFAEPPAEWGDPVQAAQQVEFFQVLEACTQHIPPNLARVFLMREWLELDADQICKELSITSTHLYVQLHRARLRLRACLELNWFGAQEANAGVD